MRRWVLYLLVTALAGVAIIAKKPPGKPGNAVTAPVPALSSLQPGP